MMVGWEDINRCGLFLNVIQKTNSVNSRLLLVNDLFFVLLLTFLVWEGFICLLQIYPFPAGKISQKEVRRSVFWTIWYCILNADSTKTHSSSVTFWRFCRLELLTCYLGCCSISYGIVFRSGNMLIHCRPSLSDFLLIYCKKVSSISPTNMFCWAWNVFILFYIIWGPKEFVWMKKSKTFMKMVSNYKDV